MDEHPHAREWRKVEGIEVRLVTGELAKVQHREGRAAPGWSSASLAPAARSRCR
jgi:hypothetical protein